MHQSIHLYRRQQVYQLDRLTMQLDQQTSAQLMSRAARAVYDAIQRHWPDIRHAVVFAGNGNNGGDAFALACLMQQDGWQLDLIGVGDLAMQSAESLYYRQQWEQQGGVTSAWQGDIPHCDLIVDGLLGIGLSRALDPSWINLVSAINAHSAYRVSIDIPSGLNADRGIAMPVAIMADVSVSFIGRKVGCYLADGPDYCGVLEFDRLGLSTDTERRVTPDCSLLSPYTIALPLARKNNSHKNQFGHVLVIGGDRSMSGAASLAALAALRTGAGVVSLCVHPDNYALAATRQMELMVSDWTQLERQLELASLIVVGPGLGQSPSAGEILHSIQYIDKPMVIDADALQVDFLSALTTRQGVITPHPGEAARLLNSTPQLVQQDRLNSLQRLSEQWPLAVVLKGAGTLTGAQDERPALCNHGHAGMATAGMGDVLAGIIAGYLAQGLSPSQAAQTAVLVHALAAEDFAQQHDAASLIASDIIQCLPRVVKKLRAQQAGKRVGIKHDYL